MKRAIKKHLRDFVAIISMVVLAVGVGGYILVKQGQNLPFIGEDLYEIKAKFATAQALVAGQGQSVKIAGVEVGKISDVQLEDGQAVVTMQIEKEHTVYKNAKMLMAPTTPLKDENIDLNPGDPSAGELSAGETLPQANTNPDVNLEEILAVMDRDTRQYLQMLLASADEGLGKNGEKLKSTFGELRLTTNYLKRINGKIAQRRTNLKRLITNFQSLTTEVGAKDDELAQMVDSVNANFQAMAEASPSLRETVKLLPGTLESTTSALKKGDRMARLLGPTLDDLRPGARALDSTMKDLRPFFEKTEPVVRDQLRPFAKEAAGPVESLRPAAARLADITPDLSEVFGSLNYLSNEMAYNNGKDQPYLFWAGWNAHNLASNVSAQDAQGVKLRGLIAMRCIDLSALNNLAKNPDFANVRLLQLGLDLPDLNKVC